MGQSSKACARPGCPNNERPWSRIMNVARQMRSYRLTQFGSPLRETIESPPVPTGSQVLLRVRACGVCHSDIHLSEGYFDLGRERKADLSKAIQPPRILGHDIVGVVDELGPDASGVHVGDRRVIYGWCGCGQCALCRTGHENLCARPKNLGVCAERTGFPFGVEHWCRRQTRRE